MRWILLGLLVNGNLIEEPKLLDYQRATRTPGFSEVTDVVDGNGNPVTYLPQTPGH